MMRRVIVKIMNRTTASVIIVAITIITTTAWGTVVTRTIKITSRAIRRKLN